MEINSSFNKFAKSNCLFVEGIVPASAMEESLSVQIFTYLIKRFKQHPQMFQ